MLSEDCRFEGFDSEGWLNLLSLFSSAEQVPSEVASAALRGAAVIITDAAGVPCASFVTERGPVDPSSCGDLADLGALAARWQVARVVVVQEGAIEEITERAAGRLGLDHDYASQWLTLLGAWREVEDEHKLRVWPARNRLPLPSPNMLRRAVDLFLPDGHVLVIALFSNHELWTACAIQRSGGDIVRVVGRELLLEWTGPLGGDFRRDQRAVQRAVTRAMGPLHLGLFAPHERVRALLRAPSPGAWARAIALREVIVSPAPPYVHVAVSADAARAVGQRASSWLAGFDVAPYLSPFARFAREHVARVGSATGILGFNPLEVLAARLRRSRPDK